MRRKLSLIMATVMVAGCFTGFAVKAETLPANIADYTPGTKNTNLMNIDLTSTRTFVNSVGRNTALVDSTTGSTWSDTTKCYTPLTLYSVSDITAAGNIGFWGLVFRPIAFTADTSYVYSFRAKKTAGDTVKLGTALTNEQTGGVYYSKEYGQDGADVTSDFQTFKYTLKAAAGVDYTGTHNIVTGFPAGTATGVNVEFDTSEADGYYFGVEQAYDITNTKTAGLDELCVGGTETLKAEVVNQIGLPGYCSQNFTWYALDTARTATVSGITVTPSSDTKTATVSVDSSVPAGQYDIVAYSSDYSMAKGYRITVVDAVNYQDYTPGTKNANLVPDASSGGGSSWLSCRNNSSIDASDYYTVDEGLSGDKYSVKWSYTNSNGDPLVLAWAARNLFDGIELNSAQKTYGFTPAANKKYVFSANLKNASPEGIAAPYIGVSMVDGNWNMYTLNTYGTQGMQLTSEWKKLEGVISLPETYISGTKAYTDPMFFGFAAGTAAGSAFWLDVSQKDAVYIAEEQAYDITNTKTAGNDTLTSGGSASFGAEIQNQIGLPGYCEQNFQWYAMNTARNTEVSGITVTPSSDTKTATVSVGSSVPAGQYDIVAYSNKYSMAKGYRITVAESVTPQLTQENGTASFTANVTNAESSTALSFMLVKYDTNGKTTGVVSDHVTVANGVATSTALNLSSLASGTKVKAFVWDANMKPLAAAQTITIN